MQSLSFKFVVSRVQSAVEAAQIFYREITTMILQPGILVNKKPIIKEFVRYALIGGLSLLIDFAIYYLLTRYVPIFHGQYVPSKVISFFISSVFNFNFNKRWTFKKRSASNLKEVAKYYSVAIGAIILNAFLMKLLLVVFPDLISWLIAAVVTALINFTLSRSWVFRRDKSDL